MIETRHETIFRRMVTVLGVAAVLAGCTFDESLPQIRCMEAGAERGEEVCRDGYWVESGDVAPANPVCEEGEERTTSEGCGAADRGTLQEVCRSGRWVRDECDGGWYRSCDELLEKRPSADSGTYELDIDGEGDREPREFRCKMEENGWTLVVRETFVDPADGWSTPERTECGDWGVILGGFCEYAEGKVSRTYEIAPVPHTRARLAVEFLQIDSWDDTRGDRGTVSFSGETIWSSVLSGNDGIQQCGREDVFSKDQKVEVSGEVETGGMRSYRVTAGADLDEGACNESWGLDNVRIFVR